MLSVIIVDYNSINTTIEYIKNLHEKLLVNGKINFVVVDNHDDFQNSTDCMSQCFKTAIESLTIRGKKCAVYEYKESRILYIFSGENLGYAKGNNLGAEISSEIFEDEYLLVSNNDICACQKIDFNRVLDVFNSDSSIAVVGPKIVTENGKPQSPHKKISVFSHLFVKYWNSATRNLIKWPGDIDYTGESKYTYRVMGSFMFIRKEAFFDAHLFDPETFMYAEEMILSERLLKLGYKTYFLDDIEVIHKRGETVKKNANVVINARWIFESVAYYCRNYQNASPLVMALANINFKIYILIFKLWKERKNGICTGNNSDT